MHSNTFQLRKFEVLARQSIIKPEYDWLLELTSAIVTSKKKGNSLIWYMTNMCISISGINHINITAIASDPTE